MSPSKPVHHHQLKVCHSALFEPVAKCWWCWRWWWRSWHLYHFSSWESLPVSPCRGHRWTSSPQPPPPTPPETSKCLSSVINMMPNQYHHHCLVIDINFKSTHLHDKIHFDNPHKGHLILFSWGSSWTFILPEYNLKMKAMLNFTLAVNIISWYQLVYIKFRTTNWKSTSKVQAARVWDNCILQHGQNTRTQENDCQNLFSSRSYKSLKFEFCVQLNFPFIILILLNGFHKFQGSSGFNSSATETPLTLSIQLASGFHDLLDCVWSLKYINDEEGSANPCGDAILDDNQYQHHLHIQPQ